MSNQGTPGVVVVSTFCRADSKYFAGFISYMDREEAVRKEHVEDFDIFSGYMDYMGNDEKTETMDFEQPEEISALFSRNHDRMTADEVSKMKDTFRTAQNNGSLMWQTVISFDNDWLQEHGLYDEESHRLNERQIKTASRSAVEKLLEKEGLQNAAWCAAIHYNTDNIHVHISAVEPVPMREQKLFKQYEVEQVDKKWQYKKVKNEKTGKMERVPILDKDGNIVEKMEYVGKFKEKSLQAAKSMVVSELTTDSELNLQINQLIRQRMLQSMKEYSLYQDEEFRDAFLDLYRKLPENKGVCNYGNAAMAPLRQEIDALSMRYIEKHHKDDYEELTDLLQLQESRYQRAYSGKHNDFAENKERDLFYRMGNAILRELKDYDKKVKLSMEKGSAAVEQHAEENGDNAVSGPQETMQENSAGFTGGEKLSDTDGEEDENTAGTGRYYISWKDGYKEAKHLIYKKKEYEAAITALEELAEKGNVLAIFELGNMHHFGRGIDVDETAAFGYYQKALEGFGSIGGKYEGYCAYRMGKQYLYGQGTEIDEQKAADCFITAAEEGNQYAMYLLGTLYLEGRGVEKDAKAAVRYFEAAADLGNAYAQYKLGTLYEQGEVVNADPQKAWRYYRQALLGFSAIEEKDDNILYRIGMMHLKGKGTAADFSKAEPYLKEAAEMKNEHAMLQLGLLYTKQTDDQRFSEGIRYLEMLSDRDNHYAQYALGNLYARAGDKSTATEYYAKAAANGNEYAAEALFRLGGGGKYSILSDFNKERIKCERDLANSLKWLKRSLKMDASKRINLQQHRRLQLEEEFRGTDVELD